MSFIVGLFLKFAPDHKIVVSALMFAAENELSNLTWSYVGLGSTPGKNSYYVCFSLL
jgi:hypothetical protein